MKFQVGRTNNWGSKKPPIDEGDFGIHKMSGRKRKYSREPVWLVEIKNLKELMKFMEKYGDIIISEGYRGYPSIEIYDDYRE